MTTKTKTGVFQTLSAINVNKFTNEKGGLTYLSWAHAWGILLENYPDSQYEFFEPRYYEDGTCEVSVAVTVDNITRTTILPVMDYRNSAIPKPNARDISDNRMRCLVKCLAMHGLGLYIYSGEDETSTETQARDDARDELIAKTVPVLIELIEANDVAIIEPWEELDRDEQTTCHKALNSKQKSALKTLLFEARKVGKGCDES